MARAHVSRANSRRRLCRLHMLRRPNEAALARGDAVIRANVSAEDRWHAKTSPSTSPPPPVCVCVCVLTEERRKEKCVRREKRKKENVLKEDKSFDRIKPDKSIWTRCSRRRNDSSGVQAGSFPSGQMSTTHRTFPDGCWMKQLRLLPRTTGQDGLMTSPATCGHGAS